MIGSSSCEIDREGDAHLHPAREVLVRGVDEVGDLGERDDVVEAPVDLAARHAVEAGRQVHVVADGQIVDEATGDLDERRDALAHADGALVGEDDAGDELEQRRLALTVPTDDADRLAGGDVEGDVAQGPELARLRAAVASGEEVLETPPTATVAPEPDTCVGDRDRRPTGGRVACGHQISFSTERSQRLKTRRPTARMTRRHGSGHAHEVPVELLVGRTRNGTARRCR